MKLFKLSRILDAFDDFMFSILSTRTTFILGFGAYLGVHNGLWTTSQFFIGLAIIFGVFMLPSTIKLLVVLVEWAHFSLFAPNPIKILKKHVKNLNKIQSEVDKKLFDVELIKKDLESKRSVV